MISLAGWLLILFGTATAGAEAIRLVFPRIIPPRTSEASVKILGVDVHGPYPWVYALGMISIGIWIVSYAGNVGRTQEVNALNSRLRRYGVVNDSLQVRIRDLRSMNASSDQDAPDNHSVEIAFEAAAPLPFLGRGVTCILQSTPDTTRDLMIFGGTLGYADDLTTGFDQTKASTGFEFFIGKRFFIKAQDGKIWGVIVRNLVDRNTIRCQFFLP